MLKFFLVKINYLFFLVVKQTYSMKLIQNANIIIQLKIKEEK